MLDYLYKTFPARFFSGRDKKPLMANIHLAIMSKIGTQEFEIVVVKKALHRYVTKPSYLYNVKAGAKRIGLDGKPMRIVTSSEENFSKARLKNLLNCDAEKHLNIGIT